MRIARPLLNTKLGKAAASAVNAAVNGAVWATYKVVDGVEWVIDKSKKAVNKVSKVASDAVNWIADTKVAQGAVGLVKDAASWVASTSVFQSAVNMAMYVYTKVSNFCTAIVESYHYYNQCRTISRRIVNEKGHLVDEHTILKTFQGISLQEAKKAENALDEDGNIRNHIESWRTALTESLLITFSNKLEKVHHDKYKVDFVKSFLKTSSALSHLESELNKMLNFHAWDKQIEYFKQVKASFEGKTTSIQMDRIHVERLPIHLLFFVEDAIEQMLKDLESRFDDEAYESSAETSDSDDIETANLVDLDKHKTWKEALTAVFSNRVHKSVEFAFIEKTISVVLGYIAAMRDTNMDPSEAQFGFVQEDKQLKQALLEYTTSNQSKQKAMFLLAELHHISQKLIDSDTHSQMKIIRHAIKYGYPLPLSSANLVANAFERFLRESKIYSAGIDLLVQDDNGKVAVAHKVGGGKAKVHIRHFNGSVFICQSDYRASISMSDHMHEEVDSAFFYEAFVSHMKNLKEAFPNQAETLRAGLLNVFVD